MARIDEGLHRLACILGELDPKGNPLVHEFTNDHFHTFCIRARLGMDHRTVKSWLNTAVAEELITVVRRNEERRILILKAGPTLEQYLKNNGTEK